MDYEKKYNEVLKSMRVLYNEMKYLSSPEALATTVTLEDNFPELKESEDEKIRKFLIKCVQQPMGSNFLDGIKKDDVIAWLEKQGQEKSIDMSIKEKAHQIAWEKSKHYDPLLSKESWCEMAALDMASWLEKQGEQNTANFDAEKKELKKIEQKPIEDVNLPEFESYLCLMLQKFRIKGMCTNGEIIDYVEEHSQKLRDILVRSAWSEEDEKLYISALWHIKNSCGNGGKDSGEYEVYNWLKSLKDRVQPKQEWSEEDKSMYIRTIGILGKCYMGELPTEVEEELNWFKSIEPKSHWKPSEEQMKALFEAKLASINNRKYFLGLLYKDLKKL